MLTHDVQTFYRQIYKRVEMRLNVLKRLIVVIIISLLLIGCSENPLIYPIEKSVSPSTTLNKTEESKEYEGQSIKINDITTPILIKGFLVGGLNKGKWMHYDEFYNSQVVNFNGYHYDVYINNTKKGNATGGLPINSKSGETLKEDKYIPGFDIIDLYDENNQHVDYDIAINADWNICPRSYSNHSTDQKIYQDLTKNLIMKEGLKNPDTTLKQVIRVDLDGDGTEEVLITADNTIDDQFEQVKKGDNAIVLFRKLVNGKVVDQVVEKDIRLKNEEVASYYRPLFRVETFSDLDGDGIMEVIIKSWYYEGEGWFVYKLIDNRLVLVASNGSGA